MSHYYDENPTAKSDKKVITYRSNGTNFEFVTDTNVFSRNEIDYGSDFLLNCMIEDLKQDKRLTSGKEFLDLGCGYGPVGIVMKSVFKGLVVTQTDVNERAVNLAKVNANNNRIPIHDLKQGSVMEHFREDEMFDIVATNPPVRAGKAIVFAFYEQAYKHMNEGGMIYVVLQRKQGAPSTEKKLQELFGNCETMGVSSGYRVMKSIKKSDNE
ncbi:MAG: methyltransferase [Clostridia bacterium]|nr:methyltransferase [Clostridia bacterium]